MRFKLRHKILFGLAAFLLLALIPSVSFAQYSATVQGTVTDPNGSVIVGAHVTLTDIATNITDKTVTGSSGGYRFPNLKPADYTITVTAEGFQKAVIRRHVSTDESAGVNVTLTVGEATATVTVNTTVEGLNPDETRMQYTLTLKDINNIPLPDRATVTMLRTAPGVVGTIETSGSTNTNIPIGQSTPDARANGRPASSNVYLLDRIPITSTEDTGALNMVPNPDMLSEIALQSTTYSVDNGATSSLQVDMTSKSGGNQFHGDFDASYTSKPFSANPDFSAQVNPFHRKYFMGSIGGPIIKNHTFFFGSVEKVDNLSSSGSSMQQFATASKNGIGAWATSSPQGFRTAGYTKLFSYPDSSLSDVTVLQTADSYYPNPAYDGGTVAGNSSGIECGTASSFNLPCNTPVIEQGLFNQAPGISGQQYNLRFDHSFHSDNDKLYFGYFGVQQNSDYVDPRPDFNTKTPSQSYYFSAGYVHVFNSNLINQFNAGLNRIWFGGTGNPNYMVFPHGTLFSFWQDPAPIGYMGGPQQSPDTPYIGSDSKEHVFALRDYVSWTKGRHSLNIGFQTAIRNYWQNSSNNYSRPYGTYFSDLLEMLQGEADDVSLYTIGAETGKWIPQVYGAEQTQFGLYVEDHWQIKPNLMVTMGIRWDDFGNPGNYGENAVPYSNTFFGTGSTLLAQVAGSYAKKVSQAFTQGQVWNFLPRGAFSWSPGFTKNLVVRGGVGLYQDAINLNQVTANLPTTTPVRLTLELHNAAEGCGGTVFWCGNGPWQGDANGNSISGVAGEPGPFAWTGTQGVTAPYGIPYPDIPVTGFTDRGLTTGPNGITYSSDMYGVDNKLKPQSTVIWSFGLEKGLKNDVVIGATYSGSYSYNQFLSSKAYNAPPGSTLATTDPRYNAIPWTQVGNISMLRNMLHSNYNAMILTAQQRKGSFSWQASYLWSHTLGNPGSGDNPSPYTATQAYGNLSIDVKNRFTLSGSYEVPGYKSGYLRTISHGWTLGGVVIAQEGTPFTVYNSLDDVNADGNKDGTNDLPNVVFQPGSRLHYGTFSHAEFIRPSGIFNGNCGAAGGSGAVYDKTNYPLCPFQNVDPSAVNPNTLEGNEPYNAFRNPGYLDVDLNLQKKTEMPWFGEQKSELILRAEGLNALNRANLNGFGSSIIIGSTSNFGQITSAENPRIIQIGARFQF